MNRDADWQDVESGFATPDDALYEEIEHTADRSFRVRGGDLRQLFTNAAHALSSIERAHGREKATITRDVQVDGIDRETLLVNWLNELLHLEHTRHESYEHFDILEIDDNHLRAQIQGRPEGEARRRVGNLKSRARQEFP